MKRKVKVKSLAKWKKDLWKIFSLYVRLRDNNQCFTCGRFGTGSGIHAGHYIVKAGAGLRLYFHEQNVHAQCYHCNINLSGNADVYNIKMVERYGKRVLKKLRDLRNEDLSNPLQYTIEDYQRLIKKYKKN